MRMLYIGVILVLAAGALALPTLPELTASRSTTAVPTTTPLATPPDPVAPPATTATMTPAPAGAPVDPPPAVALSPTKDQSSDQENSGALPNLVDQKCMVKVFLPQTVETRSKGRSPHRENPAIFAPSKLICTQQVGFSELLIEQNDRIAVAETIMNNQTNVTLHNLTATLNREQGETFCVAFARQVDDHSGVVAAHQECFFDQARK